MLVTSWKRRCKSHFPWRQYAKSFWMGVGSTGALGGVLPIDFHWEFLDGSWSFLQRRSTGTLGGAFFNRLPLGGVSWCYRLFYAIAYLPRVKCFILFLSMMARSRMAMVKFRVHRRGRKRIEIVVLWWNTIHWKLINLGDRNGLAVTEMDCRWQKWIWREQLKRMDGASKRSTCIWCVQALLWYDRVAVEAYVATSQMIRQLISLNWPIGSERLLKSNELTGEISWYG
jgi:hypothetical protein